MEGNRDGPGVTGRSVSSLHSRCPTANHQGPWLCHMVLSGLNPSSWFSALPTTPQLRASSRKLHFFLNQQTLTSTQSRGSRSST